MEVLVRDKSGGYQKVEVPAEEVPKRYLSGQIYFKSADQRIPVKSPDGIIGSVTAAQAHKAFKSGYEPVSDADYEQARLENEYGGAGYGALATGLGAARGISANLSDAAIVKGAGLMGGQGYASAIRQRLADIKGAHPILSAGGEAGGVIAGMGLGTGEESLAAEGAEALEAGRVAQVADAAKAAEKLSPAAQAAAIGPKAIGINAPNDVAAAQTLDRLSSLERAPLRNRNIAPGINHPDPGETLDALAQVHGAETTELLHPPPKPIEPMEYRQEWGPAAQVAAKGETDAPSLQELIDDRLRPNGRLPRPGEPGSPKAPQTLGVDEVPTPPPGATPPEWADTIQPPENLPQAAEHIASRIQQNPVVTHGVMSHTPVALIGRAGREAERYAQSAVEEIFGPGMADSVAGRALTAAVKYGAAGIVENGLWSMSSELDEDVLGDHDLNGEKLLAAFGHGAVLGGVFGSALGAGGSVAKDTGLAILRKVVPSITEMSRLQAYRAFGAQGGRGVVTKELIRAGFGEDGVYKAGDVALRYKILEGAPDIEVVYGRTQDARSSVGSKIGDTVAGMGAVMKQDELPTVEEYYDRILGRKGFTKSPVIEDLQQSREMNDRVMGLSNEERAELKNIVEGQELTAIKRWKDARNLYTQLDLEAKRIKITDAMTDAEKDLLTKKAIQARVVANEAKVARDKLLDELRAIRVRRTELSRWEKNSFFNEAMEYVKRHANPDGTFNLETLHKLRSKLDDQIKNWTPAPGAPAQSPRQLLLKQMRHQMDDMLVDSADRAASRMGGSFSSVYKPLKEDYRMLSYLAKKSEAALAAKYNNHGLSLTSKLVGLTMLGHYGGPGGAAGGAALALSHKLVRERGNAASALILDKLSQIAYIQKSVAKVDRTIEKTADQVAARLKGGPAKRVSLRGLGIARKTLAEADSPLESREEKLDKMKKATDLAGLPSVQGQDLSFAIGGDHTQVPKTAGAMASAVNNATQYLIAHQPRQSQNAFSDITGPSHTKISDLELDEYMRHVEGATDFHKTMAKIANGRASVQHVLALKSTKPLLYASFKMALAKRVADMKPEERERIPMQAQMELQTLWDIPVSWAQTPSAIKTLQANDIQITQSDGRSTMEQKPGRMSPSRMKNDLSHSMLTSINRIENPSLGEK